MRPINFSLNAFTHNVEVFSLSFDPIKRLTHSHTCDTRSARPGEWVEDCLRVSNLSNAPLHKLYWLLRRMLFAIRKNGLSMHLCWAFFVRPCVFAHGKAEVLRLNLVPDEEALLRRKVEVIATPKYGYFSSRNTGINQLLLAQKNPSRVFRASVEQD